MKVLLISVWKPRKGGIVTHVENLLKHSRNIFVILTYRDRDTQKEPGIIKKARKRPLVITVHGSDLTVLGESHFFRALLKWVLAEADQIIAVSLHMKNLLIGLGVDEGKIRVIYSGVDPHSPALEGERRVIFIGALVWQKAVDILIEAFKDVKYYFPDAGLVIVGDGPQRRGLEALVSRLGIQGVEFTGYVDDLDSVFTSQSVFVLPSRQEGFGLTLLEAMARSVPVVASKTGGIPEIIQDGRNGYLFTTANPPSLADAVKKVFAGDDVRARLINGGLETVKNFTWSQMAEETDDVYEEIFAGL
jgi:glycosyltransferase involved in cell wall biosynthesis